MHFILCYVDENPWTGSQGNYPLVPSKYQKAHEILNAYAKLIDLFDYLSLFAWPLL